MTFRVKNAQISTFIVIGTLLIIGAIFLLSINWNKLPIYEDETSSFKVREFVESCLDIESKNAINLIGEHGGWLYHPRMLFTDRSRPEQINKKAQGFNLLEKQKIPYWLYYDDINEQFLLNIPSYSDDTKYSIKTQIKTYLDENLEQNCLQSFRAFDKLYKIDFEPKQINSQVEFKGENIILSLNLPLEINELNTQNKEFIEKFEKRIYNEIRVPYHLAKDITIAESNSSFIEKRIMQFILPYQDSSSRDLLPPFYDFKISYDFKPWDLRKTIPLLKQIISSSIDSIEFLSTNYNVQKIPSGLETNNYAKSFNTIYTKNYLNESSITRIENPKLYNGYKNYKVKTNYVPSLFPSTIKISPSSGNVILLPRPEAVINTIPIFFTEYVAVYEMTLPILFEIKSPNNSDFTFNLALEANIDHNTPLRENRVLNLNSKEIENNLGKSLVCDPSQFISELVTLNITDPVVNGERYFDQKKKKFTRDKTGVDGAIVSFDCSGISKCFIGETKIVNNTTNLQFRLPINCNPGTLEIYKFGNKRLLFKNLNPNLNTPINLGTADMPSQRTLPLKIALLDSEGSKFQEARKLGRNETGFLIFEHLEDEDATQVVEITRENQDNLNISLMPGNYSVEGFIINNKEFTIPSEQFCYKTGIFGGEDCQDLPKIDLKAWVRSGIQLDKFEVKLKTLLNYEKLTVNFVDFGIPNSYSALDVLSGKMGNLEQKSSNFEPYFD